MIVRQYLIFLKRANKNILPLVFLALLPLLVFQIKRLPAEEKSTNIVCGYYSEESNRYMDALRDALSDYTACFVFESCDSLDALKEGVTSGRYDCGYAFEAGFSDAFITDAESSRILLYETPSSMFSTVFSEMIFGRLLAIYSPAIASHYLTAYPATSTYDTESLDAYLERTYADYMNSDSLFRLSVNGTGDYKENAESVDLFPVRSIAGFLLYVSALLGLLWYLKDEARHIYDRVSRKKRLTFCILNLFATTTATFWSVLLALWIYETPKHPLVFFLKLIGYLLLCLLFALLCLLIFRRYQTYAAALPVLLLCTMIFSPVFLDLRGYAAIFRYIAYLFPTTYF